MTRSIRPRRRLLLSALLVGAAGRLAFANVTTSQYTDQSHFDYQRVGIPDLDQKRVGLPNAGACYCVPSSTMNMLMYAANHGFPGLPPGPGTWTGYDTYYDATGFIDDLGALMQICPGGQDPECAGGACDADADCTFSCGGGGGTAQDGLVAFMGAAGDDFTFTLNYASESWAPQLHWFAQVATGPGAPLMRVSYGRYDTVAFTPQNQPIVKRSGGHAVTFAGAFANGSDKHLFVRDPAQDESPDDVFGQSTFTTKDLDVQDILVRFTNQDGGVITEWDSRWMSGLNEPHADGRMRLVDGALVMRPKQGYTFLETVIVNVPLGPGWIGTLPEDPPIIDLAANINVVCPDPDGLGLVALATPAGGVQSMYYVSPTTGASTVIAEARDAVVLTSGRRFDLYTASNHPNGSTVARFRPRVAGAQGEYDQVAAVTLPWQIDAGAYDDETDQLVLISASAHKLVRVPRTLGSEGEPIETFDIPTAVPMAAPMSVAIEPGGTAWIASPASDAVFGLTADADGVQWESHAHPDFVDPTCTSFDDAGRMYIRHAEGVIVCKRDGAGGWDQENASAFDGVFMGDRLFIERSRTNFDPEEHDGPDWEHIDPADLLPIGRAIPDCSGDTNLDGVVDVVDLVNVILDWGTDGAALGGDVDMSGLVDVQDLVTVILSWGACQ